jgi:hypothetical protein
MKRLALAITLITSAALLSGCIIVPSRGHRHHGYDQYQERGHSQDGYSRGGRDYRGPRR